MSGSSVVPPLHDYNVKVVKLQTFKLKQDYNMKKGSFNVQKSDETTIEILFITGLLFLTMSSRMEFTGPMMFLYFDVCILHNALEELCLAMPHDDDQTVRNFKVFLKEWFTT